MIMKGYVVAGLMAPSVAFAQPAPDPPPATDPANAIDPSAPPLAPVPNKPSRPPPPPQHTLPYQPLEERPPDGFEDHHGLTVELNIGAGQVYISDVGAGSKTSALGLAGLDFGIGGFVAPRVAVTGRLGGVNLRDSTFGSGTIADAYLAATVQYWFLPQLWAGAGLGLAVLGQSGGCPQSGPCSYGGVGLHLRAGVTVLQAERHSVNASIEITPSSIDVRETGYKLVGMALLVGYQYL